MPWLKAKDSLDWRSSVPSAVSCEPQAASAWPGRSAGSMADAVAGLERALAIGMSVRETVDMASPCEASSAALAACRNGEVSLSEAELRHQSFRSACEPDGLEACHRTDSQSEFRFGKFMVASNNDGSHSTMSRRNSSLKQMQHIDSHKIELSLLVSICSRRGMPAAYISNTVAAAAKTDTVAWQEMEKPAC